MSSHCGTMDKTEQTLSSDEVPFAEDGKQDAIPVNDQSKNSDENNRTNLSNNQDVIEKESIKSKIVSLKEISCNGVTEENVLLNGELEGVEEQGNVHCGEQIVGNVLSETFQADETESIPETSHEADKGSENCVTNGSIENKAKLSSEFETSIKEPDKLITKEDGTLLEQTDENSEDCGEEDKTVEINEVQKLVAEDLDVEHTSVTGEINIIEINTDVEINNFGGEDNLETTDNIEALPGELIKIPSELCVTSFSSGPPSLVKEIFSEDNSVNGDTIDLEEPMEIDVDETCAEKQPELICTDNSREVTVAAVETPDRNFEEVVKTGSNEKTVKTFEKPPEMEVISNFRSVVESKTLSKGQKLDQLLSKITSKAETDSQKAIPPPKHAKARKSCAPASSISMVSKPCISPSITSLTFNVKELEKKGVLDMPRAKLSKRKAFEPIKIPSPDKTRSNSPPKKISPVKSPVSMVRSPGKNENPFFNKQKLMRKKKKKRRAYKLPGEKVRKKSMTKKSGERQVKKVIEQSVSAGKESEIETSEQSVTSSVDKQTSQTVVSLPISSVADCGVSSVSSDTLLETKTSPGPKNALDMLTLNSRKSFSTANMGSGLKKAKKTVRQGIDPATHRTLDSFLKSGSHSRKIQETALDKTAGSIETANGEQRKRKTADQVTSYPSMLPMSTVDASLTNPDEKKRKMEVTQSTQQQHMIRLLPGSPPLSMPTATLPINPASGTGSQFFLSPTATANGSQTIIQNGTLNGLPMFQIFNQSTGSSQPAQFVAIAQSQGRSLITNTSPLGATSLIQPKRDKYMPVLFTHVPLSSTVITTSTIGSQPALMTSIITQPRLKTSIGSQPQVISSQPGMIASATSQIAGNQMGGVLNTLQQTTVQQHHTVLKNTLTQPRMRLPNGQYIDLAYLPKDSTVPNGMYPVTPPRTPEEQRSETGSQDTGEEIEAALGSVAPDKDVLPLCTCKISGASFQKMATVVTFCQALDSVDGKVLGCCNKITNPQLVRPAVKIPFLALCDSHRKRLRSHQCCPGCGHFCSQGKFLHCKKESSNFVHHFHEQCQVTKDGKNYCPHCGETSNQYEVHLNMPETKASVVKETKPNRTQVKARIGVVDRRSLSVGDDTGDEIVTTHTLEKSKKVLSTADIPVGPDRYSLERVLSSLVHERPKKYRHLPKCLYTPAYDNDLERVVYMLEDGHDPNELYEDLEGQSALHAAAAVGSLCIVHVLIQAGASPHHQDRSLKTPLMFAAENNHADVVNYLVKANAIIDAKADDGMTSLHLAAKAGHVNIINMLLNTERLNIDVTDDGGWTPLIWAAEHMEVESVKLLLKRKADPNLRDSEENTTMHWAAFSGSVAIAELLLAAGCDLDSLNMHGDRPLHIAARQDHYECVVLFLARGADVEAKNNKCETPLECCIEQNTAVYLALKVNKQLKSFGAKHMCKPDKLIHRDLSKGRENIPIPCVNGVDDEGEPKDYLYVVDNIETMCLNINRVIGSLQTCQCKDDCSSIYCACGKNSVRCWYDKYNRLIPEFNMLEPPLIFECNRACECWTTCNNRVVQNGVMSRLQVFKTVGRGWGCKTLVDIARGTFICEYIGEHISDSEADRREDDSYLFDLDNKDGEMYCIDARRYGNVARFINHLCEPNLTPVKVFVDYQDLRFPRICLFANRDIRAQEELGFDYGEKFWIIKWKEFTCTCGLQKCRYSSETIQKTLEEYRLRHELDGDEGQD